MQRSSIAEFIGTFALVFTIGCVSLQQLPIATAAIAIGGTLMAVIYACGNVSGSHFNPAVTVASFLRGKTDSEQLVPYFMAQLSAAALATAVCCMLFPNAVPHHDVGDSLLQVVAVEFVFTFLLCFVMLQSVGSNDSSLTPFYGVTVGAVMLAGVAAVGPISGAAFNPAVSIVGSAMGIFSRSHLWVYLLAQFFAAVTAAYAVGVLRPSEPGNSATGSSGWFSSSADLTGPMGSAGDAQQIESSSVAKKSKKKNKNKSSSKSKRKSNQTSKDGRSK